MPIQGDGVNTTEETIANILGGIDFGGNWDFLNQGTGSTSASGKAALLNAQLNRNKFQYQQAVDQAKLEREAAQNAATKAALESLYKKGGGYDLAGALSNISGIESTSKKAIEDQLASSLAAVQEGYAGNANFLGAEPITTQGFADLEQYLSQPTTDYYGGIQTDTPQVQNELAALLQSQGAQSPSVDAYLQGVNASLAGGSRNFQNLLQTLSALESAGLESRKREARTAGTFARTNLAQQRAALEGRLKGEAGAALSQLATQIAQQRAAAQQQESESKAALAKLLAEAGVDVSTLDGSGGTDGGGGTGGAGAPQTDLERIIAAAGGTTNQSQYEAGITGLADALANMFG